MTTSPMTEQRTAQDDLQRALELLLPAVDGAPEMDETNTKNGLGRLEDATVTSILSIMEHGFPWEKKIVRGRVFGYCRPESRTSEERIKRSIAGMLVYRDFLEPDYQTKQWVSDFLTDLEAMRRESELDEEKFLELIDGYAFVQCVDLGITPEPDEAEWIAQNLDRLKPYAQLLREHRRWDRSYLEEIAASPAPALAEGIL